MPAVLILLLRLLMITHFLAQSTLSLHRPNIILIAYNALCLTARDAMLVSADRTRASLDPSIHCTGVAITPHLVRTHRVVRVIATSRLHCSFDSLLSRVERRSEHAQTYISPLGATPQRLEDNAGANALSRDHLSICDVPASSLESPAVDCVEA